MNVKTPQKLARIMFMGSADFALPILEFLSLKSYNIIGVWTQPPRPVGRNKLALKPTPVETLARSLNLPIYNPIKLDEAALQQIKTCKPDLAIVIAYGLLLPQKMLLLPVHGCINLHASILPRWRGAAPIERAIMANDPTTGVSLMKMDQGLDTGPVIDQLTTPIDDHETADELSQRLSKLSLQLFSKNLQPYLDKDIKLSPQQDQLACYASKITRADAKLNWQQTALQIMAQYRALQARRALYFDYQGKHILVHEATACSYKDISSPSPMPPGTILNSHPMHLNVACADGYISITKLQNPGKPILPAKDFLNGFSMSPGTKLL